MAIGPVQLIVLGFKHLEFHGEIVAELERLRDSDTVRVIDALAVYKDADGDIEVAHLSNLSKEEAIELGSVVGALIGLGIEGEDGAVPRRRRRRRRPLEDGVERILRGGCMGHHRRHSRRLRRRAGSARAPLGGAAPRRDCSGRRTSGSAMASSARSTWSRSASSPMRKPKSCMRLRQAAGRPDPRPTHRRDHVRNTPSRETHLKAPGAHADRPPAPPIAGSSGSSRSDDCAPFRFP